MAGLDDRGNRFDTAALDFSPGAQVPLTGVAAGQTAATQALASLAYRDGPFSQLFAADGEATAVKTRGKKPRVSLLEPNLGEAFSRAVQLRMLDGARKSLVQSFGAEPSTVVEHCLAAHRIRRERDRRLTWIMLGFGVFFLPGTLLWLLAFQLRRSLAGDQNRRLGASGGTLMAALGVLALLLVVMMPAQGLLGWYLRIMLVAPVLGWLLARRVCERYAGDLRARWNALLTGGAVGAKVPEAVPQDPGDASAERIRLGLAKVGAEQASNLVYYAGTKGILGMGPRWGSWQLAEDLVPAKPGTDINPFRSWDVVRAVHDRLRMLERGPLHTGGFPRPSIRHWVVAPLGEGTKKIERPHSETHQEYEQFTVRDFEIQRICNEQQFGSGNRHYLGVQFVLWGGQLVVTLLVTVTVLHHTLRVEVTGHALGPVHSLFTTPPEPETREVNGAFPKFWEEREIPLPLVRPTEVVRLAARAPLTWFPPLLDYLGGRLLLPEPFGLRHAWAVKPWRHRFMADDAMRAATPVLRVVHDATMKVLAEHNCDTTRFDVRSLIVKDLAQYENPKKADVYDA